MTEPVHDMLARRGLPPGEHAADTGYASADLLLAARARGITLLAPVPPDSSPQARAGGYAAAMFAIDWDSKQVTCPQGAVSSSWTPARSKGTNIIIARFATATCQPCPARARCTTAVRSGRQLGFRHRRIHEALTAARAGQAGDAGGTGTGSAPGWRAPSPRPPTSPASAAPATSACRKPAWNTTPQPPPST